MSKRITVLASGAGSNVRALLDAGPNGLGRLDGLDGLGGEVVSVVTDRPNAGVLGVADSAGIETTCVVLGSGSARPEGTHLRSGHTHHTYTDRDAWAHAVGDSIAATRPDLVVLAGFMRILPATVVSRWPMLNVHPSLLPAFPGAKAVESALQWGAKVTGVTVHFVDEEVDHGPIVAQEAVEVRQDDDVAALHGRLQKVEHRLLPRAVALFCHNRLHIQGRHVRIVP